MDKVLSHEAEEKLLLLAGVEASHYTMRLRDGSEMHYIEAGKGKPIVLLHGINMGWGEWYPNIKELASKFRVIAVDLPGSGRSSPINIGDRNFPTTLISRTREFLDSLDLPEFSVIAHSLGGWIALKLAAEGSIKGKMVLMSPVGFSKWTPPRYRPAGIKTVARTMARTSLSPDKKGMKAFTGSVLHRPSSLAQEFVDYYVEKLKEHSHPLLWINRIAGPIKVRKEFGPMEELENIRNEILVVAGEFDPIVPPKAPILKNFHRMPNARVAIIKESGHVPSTESPAEFNSLVTNFLGE